MSKMPEWFQKKVASLQKKEVKGKMPSWFRKKVQPDGPSELDKEVIATNTAKVEGGFTEQLKATIRQKEAGRHGYDAWYGRGTSQSPVAPPKAPTQMTLNEVLEWQNTHNPAGAATTAIGAYQFVDQPNARTLSGLKREMKLRGDELFTPELQDRMADRLLERRGLSDFLNGRLPLESFANKVAREWASLPVLKPDKRNGRSISIGQSYYSGDGINKAFKGTKEFEAYRDLYSLADVENIGEL